MKVYDDGIIRDMTQEEIEELNAAAENLPQPEPTTEEKLAAIRAASFSSVVGSGGRVFSASAAISSISSGVISIYSPSTYFFILLSPYPNCDCAGNRDVCRCWCIQLKFFGGPNILHQVIG